MSRLPVSQEMLAQLKKGRDSRSTLTCVRPDGSRTWSKLHPHLPFHDITHYAVESMLGFREAFFGLVASGWSLAAFADRDERQRMPVEALWAEHIVGLLDLERGTGHMLPVADFNEALSTALACHAIAAFRPLEERELTSIRQLRGELHGRWLALAPGGTLALPFPASASPT